MAVDTESVVPPATGEPHVDSQDEKNLQSLNQVESSVENYPTGIKLVLILASIASSIFLVALDRTIIAYVVK